MANHEPSSDHYNERPHKKRRTRVSKACDECRVRKIRCDGGQPCEPCEAFDRACLYRTSRLHKLGSSHHVRALEESINRARTYIEELHKSHVPQNSQRDIDALFASATKFKSPDYDTPERGDGSPTLENMMEDREQMSSTDHKTASFYGDASGFAFLQKTRELLNDTQGDRRGSGVSHSTQQAITKLFDSPLPDKQALSTDVPVSALLPSRKSCSDLLQVVFGQVYPLLQFLHQPRFQKRTDRIYDIDPMEYDDSDHDFLPLLFAVLGLGFLFSQSKHQKYGCRRAVTEGMRHFIAARQMVDVTNCRDIESLQTLVCFILFLMSTARLVTSHTYTGLALTSAIRLGLHSQGPVNDSFSQEEQEERRRVFETIVKMDIYTSSVLGLPTLTDLPKLERTLVQDVELDIESSHHNSSAPADENLSLAASAKHLEVLLIIAKTINILYPDTDGRSSKDPQRPTFLIRITEIIDLERAFKSWRESLPNSLQLSASNIAFESLSYELEMVHNFGHIVLYRPFLHYLAKVRTDKQPDKRQLRCALACVKISKRSILRSVELQKQGYLAPASWHSVYTVFLSIITLVFFMASQGETRDSAGVRPAAEAGIRILSSCECQDTGSRRCLDVLKVLLKRISHAVKIDIDKIRVETPSLCQSNTPTDKGQHAVPGSGSSDSAKTEKPEVKSPAHHPHLDWTAVDVSQSMTEFSQLHWQPASTQPFMYSTDSAYAIDNPIHYLNAEFPSGQDWNHSSPEVSRASSSTNQRSISGAPPQQPISSLDASATLQVPSHPGLEHHSSEETIEVPYADSFAWPFQTTGAGQGGGNNQPGGQQSGQSYNMYTTQAGPGALSSEDIAAFMRINPASDPFL